MELKEGQIIIDLPRFEDTGKVIKYGDRVWNFGYGGDLQNDTADNELTIILGHAKPVAVLHAFYAPPYFSSEEAALAHKAAAKALGKGEEK